MGESDLTPKAELGTRKDRDKNRCLESNGLFLKTTRNDVGLYLGFPIDLLLSDVISDHHNSK